MDKKILIVGANGHLGHVVVETALEKGYQVRDLGPATAESCDSVCTNYGGYHSATRTYAGDQGTNTQCNNVLTALGAAGSSTTNTTSGQGGVGCMEYNGTTRYRITDPITDGSSTGSAHKRACACVDGSETDTDTDTGSGGTCGGTEDVPCECGDGWWDWRRPPAWPHWLSIASTKTTEPAGVIADR